MSLRTIRSEDIQNYSTSEQLAFYKQKFELQHCQHPNCGNEVGPRWRIYDDALMCERCYDWLSEKEREEAIQAIHKHKEEIEMLKARFQLKETDLESEDDE